MGLREQKKQRVRAAIIENAIALFRERGFDATRIQDIALPLELSDATFFNYFPTKDAVLTEWVRDQVERAFAKRAGSGGERTRSAARQAARALADQIAPDAEFLAGVWHRVRQGAASAPPSVETLVASGQARGELRADLSAQQVADLLIAGLLVAAASWLADPGDGPLRPRLQGVVDLVLDGSRKRNERVRPAVARAATSSSGRGLSERPG